jgi:proton-dependent oligopeptide transporter, POT family
MTQINEFIHKHFRAQPDGLFVILYTEICELFARFGITALLVFYLTLRLKLSDHTAFLFYGGFTALMSILPLAGGYYTDKYMGYKSAIVFGIFLMGIGNCFLAYPSVLSLSLGLSIIAVGSAFFTPSLTVLLGRLYQHKSDRDNAFVLYYIARNLGAFLATILCGIIAHRYGYSYAFLLSSFVMFSGLGVFLKGANKLQEVMESTIFHGGIKQLLMNFIVIALMIVATIFILNTPLSGYFFLTSVIISAFIFSHVYLQASSEVKGHLQYILIALFAMIVFSLFLGQGGTTLNLFIERVINRQIGHITIPPSLFYSLDPLFMLLFGGFIMHYLSKKNKAQFIERALNYFMLGLIFLAFGFFIFVLAVEFLLLTGQKPSVFFVFVAYMIFPIAELTIMPISMSFVTRLAPEGKEALMVSFYCLATGIAGYLTGIFSKLGAINFTINDESTLLQAGFTYGNVFSLTILGLFIAAFIIFCIKKYRVS